ncbi:hypothetical protein B0H66DRAFT_556831 [Apodospora peruviana]|uniref:Xylanolytic transcriptional activator regulatory domain-containing protein n=1 Tax=Apodospora peruviana TaxID=516989 RepID=A0AAE0I4M3_9PEZI|nr:hypothetical protein B0H66DRAFT_556831 [Apodospora peruviana]
MDTINSLQDLLPPKQDTDALVSFYVDHFEYIHRIVHVPTFMREYSAFWEQEPRSRHTATTALILSMISVATCALTGPSDTASIASEYRAVAPSWICACNRWIIGQPESFQGRKLVYYQVSSLVYLARRMNSIGRKRFWNETGSLIQDAILDKLLMKPPSTDSSYTREMKRRTWAVLRELDLQNSFEFQLPTLLHSLESDASTPLNVDDQDLDQDTPTPKPHSQHTRTSYQSLSAHSWKLRLGISRRLYSAGGRPKILTPGEVLRYTHEITQELEFLPSWTTESGLVGENTNINNESGVHRKSCMLSWAFLQFQLKECLLAIHRPYLSKGSGLYSLSEMICYHASRDILVLNRKLQVLGTQSLTFLREDLLIASLTLTRITTQQPKGTLSSVAIANTTSTADLLEQCLPFSESRYLRCLYGDPWAPLTASVALASLKIHLGKETRETTKAFCGKRFLGLYYQHSPARQQTPAAADIQYLTTHPLSSEDGVLGSVGGRDDGLSGTSTGSPIDSLAQERWLDDWDSLDVGAN